MSKLTCFLPILLSVMRMRPVSTSNPKFPPYVNISTTNHDSQYNEPFGIFEKQKQKYPIYRNIINRNVHFFGYPNGTFFLYNEKTKDKSLKLEGRDGSDIKKWYVKKAGVWVEDSSIVLEDLEDPHPESYQVTSSGPAAQLCSGALGVFIRRNETRNEFPVYGNQNKNFVLHQTNKGNGLQWKIIYSIKQEDEDFDDERNVELLQNGFDLAFPNTKFPWVVNNTKTITITKDYSMKVFSADNRESKISVFMKNRKKKSKKASFNLIGIIVPLGLFLVLLIGLLVIRNRKKSRTNREKTRDSIDVNPLYGENYYYESSTTIDKNTYYGK